MGDYSPSRLVVDSDCYSTSSSTSLYDQDGEIESARHDAVNQQSDSVHQQVDWENEVVMQSADRSLVTNRSNRLENSRFISKSYPLMNPSDYEIQDSSSDPPATIHKLQNLHNREINSCASLLSSMKRNNDKTRTKTTTTAAAGNSGNSSNIHNWVEIMGNNVKLATAQYNAIKLDSKIMSQPPVVLLNRLSEKLASRYQSSMKQTNVKQPSHTVSSIKKSSQLSIKTYKNELKPSNFLTENKQTRRLSVDAHKRDDTKSSAVTTTNRVPLQQSMPRAKSGSQVANVRSSKSIERINAPKAGGENKSGVAPSAVYKPKPTIVTAKSQDKTVAVNKNNVVTKLEKPSEQMLKKSAAVQPNHEKKAVVSGSSREATVQNQPTGFKIPKVKTSQPVKSESKIIITKITDKKKPSSNAANSEGASLKRSMEDNSTADASKKLKLSAKPTTSVVHDRVSKPTESNKPPPDTTLSHRTAPASLAESSPRLPIIVSPATISLNHSELMTVRELNSQCAQFNESIGLYQSFYLLSLMEVYKKRILNIDMNTLVTSHNVQDLNSDQISHLRSLVLRTVGRINYFYLLNHDSSLREFTPGYTEFLRRNWGVGEKARVAARCRDKLTRDHDPLVNLDTFLASLDKLTFTEAYILLSRVHHLLNKRERSVRVEPIEGTGFLTIKIEFKNDMIVENEEDRSIEASVRSALHFDHVSQDVFRSLNRSLLAKPGNGSIHLSLNSYGNVKSKVNDAQLVDSVFVEQRTDRIISSFHTDKLSILEIHNTNYSTMNSFNRVRINESQAPRFVQHLTMIKPNRGYQRRAEVHKMLSQDECDQKLKRLRSEKNIVIDKF